MLKAYLINIFIVLLFALAYYTNIFGFFATKEFLYFSIFIVILMLFVGYKIINSKVNKKNKEEDDNENI